MSHVHDREIKTWGSFGEYGDEPLTVRLVKDISDSHLKNIIPFILKYQESVDDNHLMLANDYHILRLMIREKSYREVMNISVPDYPDYTLIKDFKFLKLTKIQ